uniref:(northern house mosquito) hypothetical protein n=1 Tax=Culex pipiens TaxID=7175 RepID=A0A8D8FG95_CULPI
MYPFSGSPSRIIYIMEPGLDTELQLSRIPETGSPRRSIFQPTRSATCRLDTTGSRYRPSTMWESQKATTKCRYSLVTTTASLKSALCSNQKATTCPGSYRKRQTPQATP